MTKLCKDCYWVKDYKFSSWPRCEHEKALIETNLVTGKERYISCYTMREDVCGADGTLFVTKVPFWKFWS